MGKVEALFIWILALAYIIHFFYPDFIISSNVLNLMGGIILLLIGAIEWFTRKPTLLSR